jgi:hypothetical protein
MGICIKYWMGRNKWLLAVSAIAAAASVFAGGGSLIAAAFYAVIVEICAVRYLTYKGAENRDDVPETVKKLGVGKREYFNAYIIMSAGLTAVFAGIFVLCTYLSGAAGFTIHILPGMLDSHQTFYSNVFLYTVALCLVIVLLCVLAVLINGSDPVKRAMLFISTAYCTVFLYLLYLLFLLLANLAADESYAHMIAAIAAAAVAVIMAVVYLIVIFVSKKRFLSDNNSEKA